MTSQMEKIANKMRYFLHGSLKLCILKIRW